MKPNGTTVALEIEKHSALIARYFNGARGISRPLCDLNFVHSKAIQVDDYPAVSLAFPFLWHGSWIFARNESKPDYRRLSLHRESNNPNRIEFFPIGEQ